MDRYERERLEEQNDMLIEENAQLLQLNHILNETSVENEREIERLRKERDWWKECVRKELREEHRTDTTINNVMKRYENGLQQALKE